jgi:thiol-disulfide isomerase/thioredoxin
VFLGFATGISAQDMNKKVMDETTKTEILVGYCNLEGLLNTDFSNSYKEQYTPYKLDDEAFSLLKESYHGIKCTIVLGAWCGDSKEQVPHFLKIIDLLGIPYDEMTLIAVDRNKEAPEMKVKDQYQIDKVPTFIFYRDDTEIGRIIETPKESLEKDLIEILKAK